MTIIKAVCACGLLLILIGCGGGNSTRSVGGPTPTPTPVPVPGVSVSPTSGSVSLGASQGLTATGPNGSTVSVNWSENPTIGTLTPNGSSATFVAPANFPSPNTVTV